MLKNSKSVYQFNLENSIEQLKSLYHKRYVLKEYHVHDMVELFQKINNDMSEFQLDVSKFYENEH